MKLLDVHCHLDNTKFDEDRDEVINRAEEAGLKVILTAGTDPKSNKASLRLAQKYHIVQAALGAYPIDKDGKTIDWDVDKEILFIKENKDKIKAIGEVGMDFSDSETDKVKQEEIFVKMIKLAKKFQIPIIVHSRKAEKEVIDVLEREKARKVIMHCFCGKKGQVKRAADLGYGFSIPANAQRAQNFQSIIKEVNIRQIFTETDAPYLGPIRDKRNEPANVKNTIDVIAEIKGFNPKETANTIFMNYLQWF